MRAVVQRVSHASVEVDGRSVGAVDAGLLVLIGVEEGDTGADAAYIAEKIAGLRIFNDPEGKMNLSAGDVGGGVLLISQFTLHGDCRTREIGGSTINVALAKHPLSRLDKLFHALINHHHGLTADSIEGDDIHLEYTTANIVRGKRLVLGPGCAVALAEYSEYCEVSPDAQVKETVKVS